MGLSLRGRNRRLLRKFNNVGVESVCDDGENIDGLPASKSIAPGHQTATWGEVKQRRTPAVSQIERQ